MARTIHFSTLPGINAVRRTQILVSLLARFEVGFEGAEPAHHAGLHVGSYEIPLPDDRAPEQIMEWLATEAGVEPLSVMCSINESVAILQVPVDEAPDMPPVWRSRFSTEEEANGHMQKHGAWCNSRGQELAQGRKFLGAFVVSDTVLGAPHTRPSPRPWHIIAKYAQPGPVSR